MTPRILVIAGSDSGGGAGIQADIKTVMALGGHATTAITAITAQNTLGVQDVFVLPVETVERQMLAVANDIGVDAIKTGMLGRPQVVLSIIDLVQYSLPKAPLVVDPVMVATSGDALNERGTAVAMVDLIGLAQVVTPNIPELEALSGRSITGEGTMRDAAEELASRTGTAVLAKGGHGAGETLVDLLVRPDGGVTRWEDPRIHTPHTHGTGCTLASAIAVGLGRGETLEQAITTARIFVRDAILAAPGFGAGHGPMGHGLAPDLALNQVTLPLADYDASVDFYRRLGLRQIVAAAPRYARFEAPNGATLSIEAGGQAGGAVVYLECDDFDARVAALTAQGIVFDEPPRDESWGWREARLHDPAGNRLCLYRAGRNRRFPPWRLPG